MGILDRFRLDGKVAVVTGGNRGLGKQISTALAEAGARVAVISRDTAQAVAAAEEMTAATGRECRGYACDVTASEQVSSVVARILADFGQADILVNNAGVNVRRPIEELSVDEFRYVQETNVTGPWLMARALAPHFKQRRGGRLINLGSALSVIGLPDRTPYATSKGAVLQLTRTLALEWAAAGVTVNCILPGPFATEMNQALLSDPAKYQQFISLIPLGRWGNLDEIGGLVVFLASDASSYITGAAIAIDGGWTAQ